MDSLVIPQAPSSIQKGTPLKVLLNQDAIACLANNIVQIEPSFAVNAFCKAASQDLDSLELMQRAQHIAHVLHEFLPACYADAVGILTNTLTPALQDTESLGLAGFFYLPHSCFIAEYGQNKAYNQGKDPFECSMKALYNLTMRFTSEFAIRPFLIEQQDRTLAHLMTWLNDENPHVRRLCSEGTRPKLPWGKRLPALIADPTPTLPILEALKQDDSLYVRRSVANHLGDIAKDHWDKVINICTHWLDEGASKEIKWIIRHAVRHPAKKGDAAALALREKARLARG